MCFLLAQGIDLIWESVGGDMFTTCTRALAQGGRLIVIGMMSQYSDGWAASKATSSSCAKIYRCLQNPELQSTQYEAVSCLGPSEEAFAPVLPCSMCTRST